ncbi:IucA/IucC family protein [Streptomyces albireticuli]|uniref:IucA/IucC family protein n=1 Tax=Streptomyces albireticuli TaxID=1940 RepID=UPI0036C6190D
MSLFVPATLTGPAWRAANRELLAKTLAELSFEQLLTPAEVAPGRYRVDLPDGVGYLFEARRGAFESWHVDPASLRRRDADGQEADADDAVRFLREAYAALGIAGDTAGHLVCELTATLVADTGLLTGDSPGVGALADLPYAELEGHQTGHPWLIPNKGRMGFTASDVARYAPESREPLRLPWMAVHRDLATYQAVSGLSQERILAEELDEATRAAFTARLTERGLDPGDYHWLPVHPWQWDRTVVPVFGGEIAEGRVVPLGDGPDRYLPQQSIRTFTNIDTPGRRHVKLPLTIFNTLVWRGLPTARTCAAPALTSWVLGLRDADPFLRDEARVVLLGEVASVAVPHPVLGTMPDAPYQHREMLGVIWRQPLASFLDSGERARTLASLLYTDRTGRAMVTELVTRSGLSPQDWLARLFGALLPPLLHFLYQYGVAFSPHGENAIVVFDEQDVPVRLAVKDFVDDVNVSEVPLPQAAGMPEPVARALRSKSPDMLCQYIQGALLVGHFRYLADLVDQHLGVPQETFWTLVREEILTYQERFPELADRYALFDLLAPDLDRLCLNRHRLLQDGYRDMAKRPSIVFHGRVANPLHRGA